MEVNKQTTGGKDEPNIVLYAEIVPNITTRNSESKDRFIIGQHKN
jgi:hypothetical protein